MAAKLYLITRADLSFGQQAVQAAHALREFQAQFPLLDKEWYERSNTLALLATENEQGLRALCEAAEGQGLPVAPFREPDRGHELTAIALGPQGKGLVRHLPLAFSVG